MKTKNIILSAGLLGLAYLVYKNSKQQPSTTETPTETSPEETGGGGGIGGGGGGAFPLPYHPIIPALEVVVPPIPRPRPVKELISPSQLIEETDIPRPRTGVITPRPNPTPTTISTPVAENTGGTKSDLSGGIQTEAPLSSQPILESAMVSRK
jgi:hypothetical protein